MDSKHATTDLDQSIKNLVKSNLKTISILNSIKHGDNTEFEMSSHFKRCILNELRDIIELNETEIYRLCDHEFVTDEVEDKHEGLITIWYCSICQMPNKTNYRDDV